MMNWYVYDWNWHGAPLDDPQPYKPSLDDRMRLTEGLSFWLASDDLKREVLSARFTAAQWPFGRNSAFRADKEKA